MTGWHELRITYENNSYPDHCVVYFATVPNMFLLLRISIHVGACLDKVQQKVP